MRHTAATCRFTYLSADAEGALEPGTPNQPPPQAAELAQDARTGRRSAAAAQNRGMIVIKDEPEEPEPAREVGNGAGGALREAVLQATGGGTEDAVTAAREASLTATDAEEDDAEYEVVDRGRRRFHGVHRPLWSAWFDAYAEICDPDEGGKKVRRTATGLV